MCSIIDQNEKYNIVRENVVDILIKYDEFVRIKHENIIEMAENMTKGTHLAIREREPEEPMKYYRYMTSPVFKTAVESLTAYIMTNTKELK